MFFWTLLLFPWSSGCWQFDLWFLYLFKNQIEHLEFHSSRAIEAWLGEFWAFFTSMWDECNCAVVWAFFGIAFPWNWNENWPFPVLSPGVFQICWHIGCSTLTVSFFRVWNSSTGIPSPPLALFIVMLPNAYLTSHSRMSGSRGVITLSWLSKSWRSFYIVVCILETSS